MNILIVGCGQAGCYLARQLEGLGHGVSVLDNDPKRLAHLNEYGHHTFQGLAVTGFPIDVDALRMAGISDCDAVLAVTEDDNVNVMVAQVAQEIFGLKRVFAMIEDPLLKEVFAQQFSISTVSPVSLTANTLVHALLEDATPKTISFGSNTAVFRVLPPPEKYYGKTLAELPASASALLFGLLRQSGQLELAGNLSARIQPDDHFVVAQLLD